MAKQRFRRNVKHVTPNRVDKPDFQWYSGDNAYKEDKMRVTDLSTSSLDLGDMNKLMQDRKQTSDVFHITFATTQCYDPRS